MKKAALSLAFLLLLLQSFSQSPTSQVLTKSDYLQKSKHQKTLGWILLGGGVATTVLGFAIAGTQALNDIQGYGTTSNGTGATIVALAGIGAMVGSIPVFISAGKNKRRAAALSFTNQKLLLPQRNTFAVKMQPALTLKVLL